MRPQIRKRVIAVAILAFIFIVGLLFLVKVLADPHIYERALVRTLERKTERRITYVSEGITIWPWLGLRIRNVEVSRRPPVPGSPFLFARALDVHVRILPLLFRRIVIRDILLDAPSFSIARDAQGRLTLADLKGTPEERRTESKAIEKQVFSLFVVKTTIRNGNLLLVDHAAPGGRPVATRVSDLDLDLEHFGPGGRPEFKLKATIGPPQRGSRVALEGWIGPLTPGAGLATLPMDATLRTETFDPRPFGAFLPEKVRGRIPAGVFTTDLRLRGRLAEELEAKGDLRVTGLDWRGGSWHFMGNVEGSIDGVRRRGHTQGKAALRLDPGIFTKGSFAVRGRSTIAVQAGGGRSTIRIDATGSEYRHGDVFVKRPGMKLLLKGMLYGVKEGLVVENASGVIGDLPFTGAATIGRPVRAGRSTPFSLHFQPETLHLSEIRQLVDATTPFELRGEAEVTRLDILRRPEEQREWQVTTDFRLSKAAAVIPLEVGGAHTIENLAADVRIVPGLLVAENARGTLNHVPLTFRGEAREFMTVLTGGPARPRAQVTYEAREDRVDFDRLLTPGRGASRRPAVGLSTGAAFGPSEARAEGLPRKASEPASASGTIAPLRRFVVTRGEISARRAVYATQNVTNVRTVHAYDDPVVTLTETRFDAWGGAWDVTGTTILDGGPSFSLRAKAKDARVEQISAAFSTTKTPSTIFGVLSGQGTFDGRGKTLAEWQKSLWGEGRVVVRDGRLPAFNIFETVIKAMLGIFRKMFPVKEVVTFTEPTTFDRFETPYRVKDGRVLTDGLLLDTDDYHLTGKGSFGLDRTLDYDTLVALTPHGIQKMIVVASLPFVGTSFQSMTPIPMRIRGTFEKPQLYPDMSGFTPNLLRGILTGVGNTPGRAIEGGAGMIKEGIGRILGKPPKEETPPPPASPAEPESKPAEPGLIERGKEELGRMLGQ